MKHHTETKSPSSNSNVNREDLCQMGQHHEKF